MAAAAANGVRRVSGSWQRRDRRRSLKYTRPVAAVKGRGGLEKGLCEKQRPI
jgi:hypothetical protein